MGNDSYGILKRECKKNNNKIFPVANHRGQILQLTKQNIKEARKKIFNGVGKLCVSLPFYCWAIL